MGCSEEAVAQQSHDECVHGAVKGRRTKRHRAQRLSSPAGTTASSISLAEASDSTTDEQEEDLANCLILLAQGRALEDSGHGDGGDGKIDGRGPMEEPAGGNPGNYVYRCRTCDKCFPSFQALGGHRTSHKRPKTAAPAVAAMESKKAAALEYGLKISVASYADAARSVNVATAAVAAAGKSRSHECSICGLQFSSGQALGGHMRRHRATVVPAFSTQEAKKEKNAFDLDLNLPAPRDDDEPESSSSSATNLPFAGKRPLHLPALVDCHY